MQTSLGFGLFFHTGLIGLKQRKENKQGIWCVIQAELKLSIFALLKWEEMSKWKKKKSIKSNLLTNPLFTQLGHLFAEVSVGGVGLGCG